MTLQYTVVSLENMLTGNYVNIGVFVYHTDYDKPIIYSSFLRYWDSFKAVFGVESDSFSQSLVYELKRIHNKTQLQERIKGSYSPYTSLHFTEPAIGCDKSPEETLEWAIKTFLNT